MKYNVYGINIESDIVFENLRNGFIDNPIDSISIYYDYQKVNSKAIFNFYNDSGNYDIQLPGLVKIKYIAETKKLYLFSENKDMLDTIISNIPLCPIFLKAGGIMLHAASAKIGDQTYAFIASKGTGKTTTIAALCEFHNAKMIADDVVAICNKNGELIVYPGPKHMKVSGFTVNFLELDKNILKSTYFDENKYFVKFDQRSNPIKLSNLIFLKRHNDNVSMNEIELNKSKIKLISNIIFPKLFYDNFSKDISSFFEKVNDDMIKVYSLSIPNNIEYLKTNDFFDTLTNVNGGD